MIPELIGALKLDNIVQDDKTFKIFLTSDDKSRVEIDFDGYIESHKITPSKYRNKTIQEFKQHFNIDTGIFVSRNTNYQNWVYDQMHNWPEPDSFIHNMFITEEYLIDVICTFTPEITLYEE